MAASPYPDLPNKGIAKGVGQLLSKATGPDKIPSRLTNRLAFMFPLIFQTPILQDIISV